MLKDHESSVRKTVSSSKDEEYSSFKSLEEARGRKDSYLIMEGDYGGQIYLSIPVELIKCNESVLEGILDELDRSCWNDLEGAKMYFEKFKIGQIISGGMGGGVADDKLWLHEDLRHLEKRITSLI